MLGGWAALEGIRDSSHDLTHADLECLHARRPLLKKSLPFPLVSPNSTIFPSSDGNYELKVPYLYAKAHTPDFYPFLAGTELYRRMSSNGDLPIQQNLCSTCGKMPKTGQWFTKTRNPQQQALLYQQAQLTQRQNQQLAAIQASQQQSSSYAHPGGPMPSGTLPSLHPSARLYPPNAVDTLNSAKCFSGEGFSGGYGGGGGFSGSGGFSGGRGFGGGRGGGQPHHCAMCGMSPTDHMWAHCSCYNQDVVYRIGQGYAIRGTHSAVCANFNAYGCTKLYCTFVHTCTRHGLAPADRLQAHGHHDCKAAGPFPIGANSFGGNGTVFNFTAPMSLFTRPDASSNIKTEEAAGGANVPAKRAADAQLAEQDDAVLSGLLQSGPAGITNEWGMGSFPPEGAFESFLAGTGK
ncbi:hypothetical protein JCM1840_002145 [Sporobolomyces johnsonii]